MKKLTVFDLTAQEKLRLICGYGLWHTVDLGGKIPQITMSDGPVGLRVVVDRAEDGREISKPAIAYPAIHALANSWDIDTARKMGEALGDDSVEMGVNLLLAPGVNIKRNPLNGRNFEYFSEDPYLSGVMAKSYIQGVQSRGVGVCLKHFCANNLEYDRRHQSSDVDERTLREIYYLPFEIACEAKPRSIMCSYNRINGVYCSEYQKGFRVLREEFGFDGAIISDWAAVRNRTRSAVAGLDLEMPFHEENYQKLCDDYDEGRLSDEQLNECAQRVLDLVYTLKEKEISSPIQPFARRKEVAKEILAESVVLLKNDGVLPLKSGQTLALCGSFAKGKPNMLRGGGSACVKWSEEKFDVAQALINRGFTVAYEGGFDVVAVDSFSQNTRTALLNAGRNDVNILFVGTGDGVEYEGGDRQSLRLPAVQERAILETAEQNTDTVVVLFAGSAVDVSPWVDKVKAVLYVGFAGEGGDEVVADILSGVINPSGKLTETFPLEQANTESGFMRSGVTRYQEGLDVGYRYYRTHDVPVAFPFGHGLSYSTFHYSNLQVEEVEEQFVVRFEVKNTSQTDGKEVVELYVRECAPLVYRPFMELKGFEKMALRAGESQTVTLQLDKRAFAHWSTALDTWAISEGDFEVLVGASSADIRLKTRLFLAEEILK